jgi:hypothetical protein
MKLTDGRQAPWLPTYHFWVLALLLLPLASIGVYAIFTVASAEAPNDGAALGAIGTTIVLSTLLLAHERAVRRMPAWRRAVWSVAGGLLVASLEWVILLAYAVYQWS